MIVMLVDVNILREQLLHNLQRSSGGSFCQGILTSSGYTLPQQSVDELQVPSSGSVCKDDRRLLGAVLKKQFRQCRVTSYGSLTIIVSDRSPTFLQQQPANGF